jgi:hypothetical protein
METLLSRLPDAAGASFNAYKHQHDPTCLNDTRVELLRQIYDWMDGYDGRFIFWLNGLAGTGKSTIARTLARQCYEQSRLGASFFFSRGGGDTGYAGKFFTSLALQLARKSQYLRRYICEAIENSDIANQSLSEQWRQLILGPLSKLSGSPNSSAYIIVIDALDECENEKDIQVILKLISEAQSLKNVRIRVFLTSRPDTPIRYGFAQISVERHRDVILHDISASVINHDISVFLNHNLQVIRDENSLDGDWPGENVVTNLVQKANGLFIWAATACRFIEGPFAEAQISMIMAGDIDAESPEGHLNHLYTTVLQNTLRPNYGEKVRQTLYSSLRKILGSVVVLFSPLSVRSLSIMLDEKGAGNVIKDLHAIMHIPTAQNHHLRLHHPSFRDFLLNKNRCTDLNFWVDEKLAHKKLAEHCVQLMSNLLKKDICGVVIPGTFVIDIERSQVDKHLSPEVQYACLYWIQHVLKSDPQIQDNGHVHQFLQHYFLYWLEALGWMQNISEAILGIVSLESIALVS